MKKRKILVMISLIAIAVSLTYLVILLRWTFCVRNDIAGQERMFVEGYAFMPLPIVGLLTGILLQVVTIHTKKDDEQKKD